MQGSPVTVDVQRAMAASAMPQSEHERLKMRWDKNWGHSDKPFRHDKTAVLQLSWKKEHDDLNVGPELSDLGKVFKDVYGFSVQHVLLDIHKAQQQALMDLSAFVHKEDQERALLIIYYAGHGHGENVRRGDMRLEAKTNPNAELDEKTSIVWSKAETAMENTEADVLLIFDCCDAGRLGRPVVRNGLKKSYFQFLGACAENETTMGPGEQSFTTALIWALKELAQESSPFSTAELRHKIMTHERFPGTQMPILTERRAPFENIMLSVQGGPDHEFSAELAPSTSEREREMQRREHIDLRFHFEHKIDNTHIDHTIDGLKNLLHHRKAHWTRVSFLAKSSVLEQSSTIHRFATMWMASARERRKSVTPGSTTAAAAMNGAGFPTPPAAFTDLQPSVSPAALPDHPFGLPGQQTQQKTSNREPPRAPNGDDASHLSGWTEVSSSHHHNEDSILFHIGAIMRTLRLRLSGLLSRVARWLVPHSEYERMGEGGT